MNKIYKYILPGLMILPTCVQNPCEQLDKKIDSVDNRVLNNIRTYNYFLMNKWNPLLNKENHEFASNKVDSLRRVINNDTLVLDDLMNQRKKCDCR